MKRARIVISTGLNPWRNLSIEEYLVRHLEKGVVTLFLWKNDKTVVIGKHQNPWRECNMSLLEKEHVTLARRMTGGGAVYHGLGNINFSFVMPKEDYDVKRQMEVILNMCKKLGIEGQLSGRNDITVDGKKFSGNAFYHGSDVSLHHGTLLVNENMTNLGKYLTASKAKMRSKGVESVKSRVTNLSNYYEGLDTDIITQKCIESFREAYSQNGMEIPIEIDPAWFHKEAINKLYEKNASWDWRFGKGAKFDILHEIRFPWGEVQLHFNVKNAMIKDVAIYSDALDQEFIEELPGFFVDKKYEAKSLADHLRQSISKGKQKEMMDDLAMWILELGF